MLKVKVADAAAKINPEILLIEHAEIFPAALQQTEAVVVEGGGVNLSARAAAHALLHFIGGVRRVGERQDFVGCA